MSKVYLRDASQRPRLKISWHFPADDNPRISACGCYLLITDDPADPTEIATRDRCQLVGCRGRWPS